MITYNQTDSVLVKIKMIQNLLSGGKNWPMTNLNRLLPMGNVHSTIDVWSDP